MHNLLQEVEWSRQQFEGPGLQDYGLATPLTFTADQETESKKREKEEKGRREKKKQRLNLFSELEDWAARLDKSWLL